MRPLCHHCCALGHEPHQPRSTWQSFWQLCMHPLPFAQLFGSERHIFPGFCHVGFFFQARTRAQNPNPYFTTSDLLTHLDERIICLCSAANRWREHTVLCLKVGNADEMRTIILSVYQQRQLLLGELAPCSHAASRGVNRLCTNSETSVSCIWTSWTQGKWFHVRCQLQQRQLTLYTNVVMMLWNWIN